MDGMAFVSLSTKYAVNHVQSTEFTTRCKE